MMYLVICMPCGEQLFGLGGHRSSLDCAVDTWGWGWGGGGGEEAVMVQFHLAEKSNTTLT